MDVSQQTQLKYQHRRRGCNSRKMHFHLLMLLGLWISNTIIGCTALPHPQPQRANSISKSTEDDNSESVAVALGAPLIIPLEEEVQLEVRSDFTLRCEDTEPIVWKYPIDIPSEETSYRPQDERRQYGIILKLVNVDYTYVANYYCVKAKAIKSDINLMEDSVLTDLANNNDASAIYVYVNDKEHHLATMSFPVLHVIQFQDAVIPCKPTMPNYDVLLTTPSGSDDVHITLYSNRSSNRTIQTQNNSTNTSIAFDNYSYNPKLGFIVRGPNKFPSFLTCVGNFEGTEPSENDIHVKVFPSQLDKPTTEDLELTTTTTVNPSVRTTTIISTKTTTEISSVTNPMNMNVTNSISVNLTKHFVDDDVDVLKEHKNVIGVGNRSKSRQNFGNNGDGVGISISIHHRILGDHNNDYFENNANDANANDDDDNDNDNDDNNDNDDEDDDDNVNENYNEIGEIDSFESVTESYLSKIRKARHAVLTTRRPFDRQNFQLKQMTTRRPPRSAYYDKLNHDIFASSESNESTTAKKVRRDSVTTRRPSHHDRSTTSYTTHVDKPNITSIAKHHAPEGGTFELICNVKIAHDVKFKIEWILPKGVQIDGIRITNKDFDNTNMTVTHRYGSNVLTVKNAKTDDSGKYTCKVSDHSNNKAKSTYNMIIMRKDESYINISEPNNYYTINEKANKTVQMTVRYSGYPWPTLKWYNPNGTEIFNNQKFQITNDDVSSTLKIYNTRLWDTGTYVVEATNAEKTEQRDFNVTIEDVPFVMLDDVFVRADEKAHVQCKVQSHRKALVTWVFQPCSIEPRWPSCSMDIIQDFNETSSSDGATPIDFIYNLHFVPKSPGIIRCVATTRIGQTRAERTAKSHILIRDIDDNMDIKGIDDNRIIALDDEVTITCIVVAYYFSGDVSWYNSKGEPIEETENIAITNFSSPYSYQNSLTFKKIADSDQGRYECRARSISDDTTESRLIDIITHEPSSPRMTYTNMGDSNKIKRKLGESVDLRCESEAIPKATVSWYKNDELIVRNDTDSESTLSIPYLRPEDQGQYKCVVANRLGKIEESVNVQITNIPGLTLGWIAGILLLLVILIGLVIYLYLRVKRERKLLRELKAAGLANFEEGAVEHINPALTLDEQADLLPYDRGFEFPREKLKLGKQLGAGAFGVVLKAHAEGIKPEEKESVVAVKMVKRQANNEVMKALVSELKIMVHLGQHLNVVNLLGAVTKNIAKRELMVIVEYCRYGNIQNFLMRNRKRFINQINPNTGKIDPTIMTQRFSDNFELNRESDNDPRSGTRAGRPNSTGYITQSELYEGQVNTCATEQTVMTTVPEGVVREEDDDNIMSNNSVQPAWRSNYKPDSTEAMAVTTTDLISWAFQVSCGMEYLSSKKVLHGDLAARNILLCEDNIVKICDFGLARSMYKGDNYKKQGDAPLPIKWLALESLSDHIFSTYTDVWSFGIVMWEIFSLAKVPYPEIDANQSLYLKLKDGYRMEKPPYANDDLYDVMLECWSTNPERRPLFNVLKERFAVMLGEEATNHYVDLNEPYLRVNTEYLRRNQTDYLSLMGSPDEMAPPPPRYVNGHILPEIRIDLSTDDYLTMSPNGDAVIFSPTRPKDSPKTMEENVDDQPPTISATSFNFPDSAAQQHSPTLANNLDSPISKPPRNKKEGIDPLPEEIPMLYSTNQGDDSPDQPRKYTQTRNVPTPSPRHHVAETQLQGDNENYVNIKSPKKFINNNGPKAPDAFSNPSYQIIKTGVEE